MNHKRSHDGQKIKVESGVQQRQLREFECPSCGEIFKDKEQLRFHRTIHAKSHEINTCTICKKVCETTDELRDHYFTHTVDVQEEQEKETKKAKVFDCQHCYKSFLSPELLREHLQSHGVMPLAVDEILHKCNLCGKTFSQVSSLRQHEGTHRKDFPCSFCEKCFNRRDKLAKHMKMHKDAKPFACTKCGKSYDDQFKLDHHMRVHFGTTDHVCLICNKHFQAAKNLKRHMILHTGEKPYQCDHCGSTFPRRDKLTAHLKGHASRGEIVLDKDIPKKTQQAALPDTFHQGSSTETKKLDSNEPSREVVKGVSSIMPPDSPYLSEDDEPENIQMIEESEAEEPNEDSIYDCVYCYKSFLQLDLLRDHMEEAHDIEMSAKDLLEQFRFTCSLCKNEFSNQQTFSHHMKTHTKQKTFNCTICAMSFDRYFQLVSHSKVHQSQKAFPCQLCGRSFDDAVRLENHTKVHTNQKDFKCTICEVGFQSMKNLRRHIQTIHSTDKPYTCSEEGCNMSFGRKDKYVLHQRYHERMRNIKCRKCDKILGSQDELQEHMVEHINFTKCDHCDETFVKRKDMLQHKRLRHTPELFVCSGCGKNFQKQRYLKKHLKKSCYKKLEKKVNYDSLKIHRRIYLGSRTLLFLALNFT